MGGDDADADADADDADADADDDDEASTESGCSYCAEAYAFIHLSS